MSELINSFPDFKGAFGDKRLERRAEHVLKTLTTGRDSSLRRISHSNADQRSFYRLLNNDSVTEKAICNSIVDRCGELCENRHVLCIQDTAEFNLSAQRGRLKADSGLGDISQKGVLGFLLHSSLVIDALRGTALGYSSIKAWERKIGAPGKNERDYSSLPIQQKESYKWIESALESKALLQKAASITIVSDRESDIYDLLVLQEENFNFIIRSNFDRKISGGTKLSSYLATLEVMHRYSLALSADLRSSRQKRTAAMEVKWSKITIVKPQTCKDKDLPETLELYVVDTCESTGSKGIHWRLLTTHPVTTAEEAMLVIEWYRQRWNIEQIHRLLKTEGFRIERSQLEQGWAIRKLTLLAMMGALRILQMMFAYNSNEEQDIHEVFESSEGECLKQLNMNLEGETEKQRNPYTPLTLKWGTWIIARLGGWKGYQKERRPGPIVLQKGLAKFYSIFQGWLLFKNSMKDVYTQ